MPQSSKNRQRLLAHDAGRALFEEVVWAADAEGLLSDEHFSVGGTLIEEAVCPGTSGPGRDCRRLWTTDPGNPSVDFCGARWRNATHTSIMDSEARLLRKGQGQEARLVFLSHDLMGEPPSRPIDGLYRQPGHRHGRTGGSPGASG